MNMTINEAYLKGRMRTASQRQAVGLLFVILSFVLSLFMGQSYWLVFVAYPLLIIGFPLWQMGRGQVRYWRAMKMVPAALLETLRPGPKEHVYAFLPVDGTIIDFLLVTAEGLFVVELKGLTEGLLASGPRAALEYKMAGFKVSCKRVNAVDRWSQSVPPFERLARLGEPGLGNPSAALAAKIAKLTAWLAAQNVTRTPVPVRGLIVFRNDKTPLEIEDANYEVFHFEDLRPFLSYGRYFDEVLRPVLATDDRNRINGAVRGLLGPEAATPAPAAAPKAPERKLSAAAKAEQERVREIRAARAATPAAAPAPRTPAAPRPGSVPPAAAPKRSPPTDRRNGA